MSVSSARMRRDPTLLVRSEWQWLIELVHWVLSFVLFFYSIMYLGPLGFLSWLFFHLWRWGWESNGILHVLWIYRDSPKALLLHLSILAMALTR